jgi:hypothetical protein
MSDNLRTAIDILLDRRPAQTRVALDIPADVKIDVDELGSILHEAFAADQTLSAVSLRDGQTILGTVSRERLEFLKGPSRSAADGDGFQLPGESTRYRLLRYRCRTAGCGVVELRLVLRPQEILECPAAHGPLKLEP